MLFISSAVDQLRIFLFRLDMNGQLVKKVHVLNKVIVHLIDEFLELQSRTANSNYFDYCDYCDYSALLLLLYLLCYCCCYCAYCCYVTS